MKNINVITTVLSILLMAIISYGCTASAEQIKGNGKVVSIERKIEPFSAIKLNGVFNVMISQGEKESLTIEADDNLVDLIESIKDGDTLIIKQKKESNFKPTKFNIYITIKDIKSLESDIVGNIVTSTPLNLKDFNLSTQNVGSIKMEFNSDKFFANINSVGDITLKGRSGVSDIKNSSVGNIHSLDFVSDNLILQNSNIGDVEVSVEKEFTLTTNGIGNVLYKGNPVVKFQGTKGIGKIKKI